MIDMTDFTTDAERLCPSGFDLVARPERSVLRPDGAGVLPRRTVLATKALKADEPTTGGGVRFRWAMLGVEVFWAGRWWFCQFVKGTGAVSWNSELLERLEPCWCLGQGRSLDGSPCEHCANGVAFGARPAASDPSA